MAANLALYSSTGLWQAYEMQPSDAREFFESAAFSDWKKAKEAEMKLQVAGINRLNDVIRAIGSLGKSLR